MIKTCFFGAVSELKWRNDLEKFLLLTATIFVQFLSIVFLFSKVQQIRDFNDTKRVTIRFVNVDHEISELFDNICFRKYLV